MFKGDSVNQARRDGADFSHNASDFTGVFRRTLNSTTGRDSCIAIVKVIYSCLGADTSSPGLFDHRMSLSPHDPVGDALGLIHHAAVGRGLCPVFCHHFAAYLAPDSRAGVCVCVGHLHPHFA